MDTSRQTQDDRAKAREERRRQYQEIERRSEQRYLDLLEQARQLREIHRLEYEARQERERLENARLAEEYKRYAEELTRNVKLSNEPIVYKFNAAGMQLQIFSVDQWIEFDKTLIPVYSKYYLGITLVYEDGRTHVIRPTGLVNEDEGLLTTINDIVERWGHSTSLKYFEHELALVAIIVDIDYLTPDAQPIGKVGEYHIENCVIAAIRHCLYSDTTKSHRQKTNTIEGLYAKCPQFKVTDTPVFLNDTDLATVSKYFKVKFNFFTILGRDNGTIWKTIGSSNYKQINVLVNSNHGTLISTHISAATINYHDKLDHLTDNPLISFSMKNDLRQHTLIMIENNIHKVYRPSELTSISKDDNDLKYAFVTSPSAMFFKRMQEKFDIRPTKLEYRFIIKPSELFINRRKFMEPTEMTTLVDLNKAYIAYKQCKKYYRGFPTSYALDVSPDTISTLPTAFYVIDTTNVVWRNPLMEKAFNMLYQSIHHCPVLPAPLYDFISEYAKVPILNRILSTFVDFDIEAEIPKDLSKKDRKEIYTKSIGMFIKGGLCEETSIIADFPSETERLQLIRECHINGHAYVSTPTHFTIYKNKPSKGSFHVHSYILAYSGIQVCTKLYELLPTEQVYAVNVDGILMIPREGQQFESSTEIGGWSVENIKTKKCYFDQPITVNKPPPAPILFSSPSYPNGVNLFNLTIAAAGTGKTAHFTMKPHIGQTNLFYTRSLRNETQLKTELPCMTTQRFHKSSISGDARTASRKKQQQPAVVFEDETFMQSSKQWNDIIKDAIADQSFVFTAGDPCQIRQSINATPVSIKYFQERDFTLSHIVRTRELTLTRHSFTYGEHLDTYRDLGLSSLSDKINDDTTFNTITINDITNDDQIIVGTHAAAKTYNDYIRSLYPATIRCRHNVTKEVELLPLNDSRIFWDKTHATTVVDKHTLYVPTQATTIDSLQGITIESRVVVHVNSLIHRQGALYTAITRARTPDNTVLIYD